MPEKDQQYVSRSKWKHINKHFRFPIRWFGKIDMKTQQNPHKPGALSSTHNPNRPRRFITVSFRHLSKWEILPLETFGHEHIGLDLHQLKTSLSYAYFWPWTVELSRLIWNSKSFFFSLITELLLAVWSVKREAVIRQEGTSGYFWKNLNTNYTL